MNTKAIFCMCSVVIVAYFISTLLDNQPKEQMVVELSKDCLIVNEIRSKTARELKEKMDLHLAGTGASMMDEIKMLSMSFSYYHEVDLSKARRLLVGATRTYLRDINENKEIRPYLKHYPFTVNDIEIKIAVFMPNKSKVKAGKIHFISCYRGCLKYSTYQEEDGMHITLSKEPYEEALRIVEEQEKKTTT